MKATIRKYLPSVIALGVYLVSREAFAGGAAEVIDAQTYVVDTGVALGGPLATLGLIGAAVGFKLGNGGVIAGAAGTAGMGAAIIHSPDIVTSAIGTGAGLAASALQVITTGGGF